MNIVGIARLSLALPVALLLACGGKEEPESIVEPVDAGVREATAGAAKSRDKATEDPCAILAGPVIRAEFGLDAATEIQHEPSKYSPHPLCTARWQKPNAAELEQQSQAAMQEYMKKKMRGEEARMPSFRTTDEVTLTLYKGAFDSEAAAQQAFDSAMAVLNQGITGGSGDVEVKFQADTVPVEGIGDKAMWAEKMRQLSVVSGRRIFHLSVKTTGEAADELAHARHLAPLVAEAL